MKMQIIFTPLCRICLSVALTFFTLISVAQTLSVKGTVTDEKGEPQIGVNIRVKGTNTGQVTDLNGNYSISAAGNQTLIFSFIGYNTQEIPINNRTNINVVLTEDVAQLGEVVVVGYGTLQKKQVTSAVTSISAKDLTVGVGGADITRSLQGKIGGLVMYDSGSTNAGSTIQLRGMTSINAGKAPLVVIDGFPGGDIRSVNIEDIKSIDVLKDASAGAIYGTRAASGVILITTKNGTDTNGKINVTYSTEFTHRQGYRAPEMMSGAEYREYVVPLNPTSNIDYGHDTDWWQESLNKKNFSQKHHVGINMGTQKASLYTSFFYEKQEGVTLEDGRTDYGGRLNANFKLLDDWLEINPSVDYRQAQRSRQIPNFERALFNNPTRNPYIADASTTDFSQGYNVWLNESLDYNFIADIGLSDDDGLDKWFKPQVMLKLNVKSIEGLSVRQTLGYENRQWERHYWRSRYHRDELTAGKRQGTGRLEFSKTENLTSEGYANYVRDFSGGHSLNAVAGYSYFERNGENFNVENYNFPVENVKYWNIGSGTWNSDGKASMGSGKDITERLFSMFGRINYAYMDKYLFMGSVRHEGSSKFAAQNRWATFWSASGAWRISNESFMKDISWVDDLKVRVAYGVTGNNNFSSSYMADMLGSDTWWMMPNGSWAMSFGKTQNVNRYLGWEEKKEWNFGVDFSLFGNRLYGKVDYFRRLIDGLIYSVQVPQPPFTQETQYQNIGSMQINGWEIEIGGIPVRTADFMWTTNLNVSHSQGTIKTLWGNQTYYNGNGFPAPGSPGDAARYEEGSTIGAFYLWKYAGLDENGKWLVYDKDNNVIPADNKKLADKRYIGNYTPAAIIGWNNTLTYKNWDFGINLRSWIDFDIFNTLPMYFGILDVGGQHNRLKSALTKYKDIHAEKQLTDFYLEDGTFLKIDAISLGYTLPMKKYTRLIESIRLFATVGNVAVLTGYSGMNPEVNITGWDKGTEKFWDGAMYPLARTYTVGLKLNF